jgi:hypothetical protein
VNVDQRDLDEFIKSDLVHQDWKEMMLQKFFHKHTELFKLIVTNGTRDNSIDGPEDSAGLLKFLNG